MAIIYALQSVISAQAHVMVVFDFLDTVDLSSLKLSASWHPPFHRLPRTDGLRDRYAFLEARSDASC